MYLALIKARRIVARWPSEAWRSFRAPIFNDGQMVTFAASVIGLIIVLNKIPLVEWGSELGRWATPLQAFAIALLGWSIVSMIVAPFRIVSDDRKLGRWQKHHYIYNEPKLVFVGRFEHNDGDTQSTGVDFRDVEPSSFVYARVQTEPDVPQRVLVVMAGGKPNPQIIIRAPIPGQVTMGSRPGSHVGFRISRDKSATIYVRLEPMTTPVIVRMYCGEFFVGKDEFSIGQSFATEAMMRLWKLCRQHVGKFIFEHEYGQIADTNKLDTLVKGPVREVSKEALQEPQSDASSD